MTLADLDLELVQLRTAVGHIGANLVALEQDPTVALLDVAGLRGASADRWGAARIALADLFASYQALGTVVERATALRGTGRWLAAPRTRQLGELLHERSVVVTGATVTLADRPLLGASRAATTWTPTALLDHMATSFDEIQAVVATATRTWDVAVARTGELRRRLDHTPPGAVRSRLEADLDAIAADVLADPLVHDGRRLDHVATEVDALERDASAAAELRDDLAATIATARSLLEDVTALVAVAADTAARVGARIAVPADLPTVAATDDLAAELERIADQAADGRWSSAAAGLVAWRVAADGRRSAATTCAAAHQALLLERAELRGRLDAYRAKADHDGRLEDPLVTARYAEAHDALHTAPTDLVVAAELVHRYQETLAVRRPVPCGERR